MYRVVFETIIECSSKGAITWGSFESKEAFDKWNDEKMKSWYKVVDEGVTEERAIELCSTPQANQAYISSELNKLGNALSGMLAHLQ